MAAPAKTDRAGREDRAQQIRVAPRLCTDRQLPDWVALAHAYVASLPHKKK